MDELKSWLTDNEKRLRDRGYTVDDIARVALACGYDAIAVAQWQTYAKFFRVA